MSKLERQEKIDSAIVQALLNLTEENKLSEITAEQIAKTAEVSKRTLYKYYKSKEDMYLAMVLYAFTKLNLEIESRVNPKSEPIDRILAIGTSYLSFMQSQPHLGRLMVNYDASNYDSTIQQAISDIANKYELLDDVTKHYALIKHQPSVSIESIVIMLWSSIQGFCQLALSKGQWLESYYQTDLKVASEDLLKILSNVLNGGRV